METFKVIVAGSRHWRDRDFIFATLDRLLPNFPNPEIVSGCCGTLSKRGDRVLTGADLFGEDYAKQHELPVKRFPADWDNLGDAAGPIRNKQMAEYADALILFRFSRSVGSRRMLEAAKLRKLPIWDYLTDSPPSKETPLNQVKQAVLLF